MSVSTMGYGANTNSKLFKLNVDGNTKFEIDTKGLIIAKDITANSVTVNTLVSLSNASYVTTNTLTANVITTNSLTVANRNITKSSMPTGSILQVVQVVKTDIWNTTSTTPVDITGMTASITPTSSTSKIMVRVDLKWSIYGHGDVYLLRDGTKIYYGDAYGIQTQSSLHSYGSGSYGTDYALAAGGIEYLDSPATTSSTTYKVQFCSDNNTGSAGVMYGSPLSTIILMEVTP